MADFMKAALGAWMKYLTEDQDLQVVHDVVEKMFTPDVKFQVIGQPGQFQLAAAGESVQAMKSYYSDALFPAILSVLDVTKPVSSDLISMIHDEPQGMIVMEAKTSGLAKDGQPFILDVAVIGKIGPRGTLSEIRFFFDTLLLQSASTK